MKYTLLIFCICIGLFSNAQEKEIWYACYDKANELLGYQDEDANIKIPPKFGGGTYAYKFDAIIAVMQVEGDNYQYYYMTKTGKKVGVDQLHSYDNGLDCESEGFIRFQNKETDKVGLFNADGAITIPAEYNNLQRVKNGLIVGIKGAKKENLENHKEQTCNHYKLVGGTTYLLAPDNTILIENFKYHYNLNLYSLKITPHPTNDPVRFDFLGKNGNHYSFIDFEKEFKNWLKTVTDDDLTLDDLLAISHYKITSWKKDKGWHKESKNVFIKNNFELIKTALLQIKQKNSNHFITSDGLNPYTYNESEFEKYFNNCGEALYYKYPVMNLILNYETKEGLKQNHFYFLRTDKGYQLIQVAIDKGEIK